MAIVHLDLRSRWTKNTIKLELIKYKISKPSILPFKTGNAKISLSTFQITSMPCYSKNFTKPYLASLSLSGNTQISLQDTVIPYVPNSIGMLPKQASFLLLLVTLKSFYLPLSSHSVPVNPAKQEHVYPAAILFFVASVHVPPFWQGFIKQGPTTVAEISKNKDLERNFRKTWNSIKVNKNICMISMLWIFHL